MALVQEPKVPNIGSYSISDIIVIKFEVPKVKKIFSTTLAHFELPA